jgi:metallo-beta-lactamase family protein
MIDFLNCQDQEEIRQIFLVHGEYESQQFYQEQLEIEGFRGIEIPKAGEEFEL